MNFVIYHTNSKSEKVNKNLHEAFVPILKQIISFGQSKKDEVLMCSAAVCFQAFGNKSDIPISKHSLLQKPITKAQEKPLPKE